MRRIIIRAPRNFNSYKAKLDSIFGKTNLNVARKNSKCVKKKRIMGVVKCVRWKTSLDKVRKKQEKQKAKYYKKPIYNKKRSPQYLGSNPKSQVPKGGIF